MSPVINKIGSKSARGYGAFLLSIVRSIVDSFNRTTTGNLGKADVGGNWKSIRGIWTTNGSSATTSTAPSSYPIAAIPMASGNRQIKAVLASPGSSGGVGLSFWVTNANNWWASSIYHDSSSSSVCDAGYQTGLSSTTSCCATATSTSVCNSSYQTGLSSTASCCASATSSCNCSGLFQCTYGSNTCYCCTDLGSPAYPGTLTYSCYTATTTTYSCFTSYTTTTTYRTKVNVWSSTSGSVLSTVSSTISSSTSTYPSVGSMIVDIVGDNITTSLYSDSAWSSLRGTSVYNSTSAVKGSGVGVFLGTTLDNQGTSIDSFIATVL